MSATWRHTVRDHCPGPDLCNVLTSASSLYDSPPAASAASAAASSTGWPGAAARAHYDSCYEVAKCEWNCQLSQESSVPVTSVSYGDKRESIDDRQLTSLSMYKPPYLGVRKVVNGRGGGWKLYGSARWTWKLEGRCTVGHT